jgi:hypothetical protein
VQTPLETNELTPMVMFVPLSARDYLRSLESGVSSAVGLRV